jgi:dUTP pyrophosphatase
MVVLLNTDGTAAFEVEPGMRIAQLVLMEVPEVDVRPVEKLPESERGARGHGSSGA